MPAGRPSIFSDAIADRILEGLMDGRSLRQICTDKGMPDRVTVIRWMAAKEDFATKCAKARTVQADLMDDLILETAHNCTPATAQADKVKISAYQWRAAKLVPKRYGDKVALTGGDGGPIRTLNEAELAKLSDEDIERLLAIRAKLAQRGDAEDGTGEASEGESA